MWGIVLVYEIIHSGSDSKLTIWDLEQGSSPFLFLTRKWKQVFGGGASGPLPRPHVPLAIVGPDRNLYLLHTAWGGEFLTPKGLENQSVLKNSSANRDHTLSIFSQLLLQSNCYITIERCFWILNFSWRNFEIFSAANAFLFLTPCAYPFSRGRTIGLQPPFWAFVILEYWEMVWTAPLGGLPQNSIQESPLSLQA